MKIKALLILVSFFIIPLSSAIQAGISPSQISFSGNVNEELCKNITLYSQGTFVGEDKWSPKDSRDLNDYNLTSKSLGIISEYLENPNINGNISIKLCITATKPGRFYGALIYSQDHVGVGVWMYLNIENDLEQASQDTTISEDSAILTGSAIGNQNHIGSIIFIELFILTLCLIFLIILYKRQHLN